MRPAERQEGCAFTDRLQGRAPLQRSGFSLGFLPEDVHAQTLRAQQHRTTSKFFPRLVPPVAFSGPVRRYKNWKCGRKKARAVVLLGCREGICLLSGDRSWSTE